jgi:hypothetical protein
MCASGPELSWRHVCYSVAIEVKADMAWTSPKDYRTGLGFAVDLMRRFMPDADQGTLVMAAVWLVGHCTVFIRHREQLAAAPVSLNFDDAAVERLTALISNWALAGLAHPEPHARRL